MTPKESDFVTVPAKVLRTQIVNTPCLARSRVALKNSAVSLWISPRTLFFLTLVDPIMGSILSANALIRMIFIGHQMRFYIDKAIKRWGQLCDFIAGHRCGPNLAVVFHRHQRSLFSTSFTAFIP